MLSRAFYVVCLTGLVSLAAPTAFAQSGGANDLTWNTVDTGGTTFSTGGAFAVSGTIGQPDAVSSSGGNYVVIGGFWAGVDEPEGSLAIPTLSEWGFVISALSLLAAGTLVLDRRRATRA